MANRIRTAIEIARQARGVSARTGVPVREQFARLVTCRRAAGIGREEFFMYRLWRPELDDAARLSYLSLREHRAVSIHTSSRQAGEHRILGKSQSAEKFAAVGIPVPEALAGINGDRVGAITDQGSLARLLEAEGSGGVVVKPENGLRGEGVIVAVSATGAGLVLVSGEFLPIEELWDRTGANGDSEWRIERRVIPDASVSGWWRDTTPTVRVLTLLLDEGPVIHAASVRIPNGSSGVDNLAQGNLVAKVDLETGMVGPATDGSGITRHDHHPANGSRINGVTIPLWSRYLAAARAGAPVIPRRRSLGWDLAITEAGPVVLEANAPWCSKVMQLPTESGIVRGAFIRLMHQTGGGAMFSGRRKQCREWRRFEQAALDGEV